jgi:hypothetical protein
MYVCLWYHFMLALINVQVPTTHFPVTGFTFVCVHSDRLCGLVVSVLGYRSGGPVFDFPALPEKKVVGLERGSTQPREYN